MLDTITDTESQKEFVSQQIASTFATERSEYESEYPDYSQYTQKEDAYVDNINQAFEDNCSLQIAD